MKCGVRVATVTQWQSHVRWSCEDIRHAPDRIDNHYPFPRRGFCDGKEAVLRYSLRLYLWGSLVLFAASGASCPRQQTTQVMLPPAFTGPPTLDEVIRQVNGNSAKIRQLRARGAALSAPGLPSSLRTELTLERPHHFRMRADTALTGTEMDLGSNHDVFWMWVKRAEPRAVYFCRHEQFYQSAARQVLPVEPHWLISALGVVEIDPLGRHSGPHPAGPGRLEVTSLMPTANGDLTRVLVLHDIYGTILEQHLKDANGNTLASSFASEHRPHPVAEVVLPHRVDIQLPPTNMSFAVSVDGYDVNGLGNYQHQLWKMPEPTGFPMVDLAAPGFHLTGNIMPSSPANAAPEMQASQAPRTPVIQPVRTTPVGFLRRLIGRQ